MDECRALDVADNSPWSPPSRSTTYPVAMNGWRTAIGSVDATLNLIPPPPAVHSQPQPA